MRLLVIALLTAASVATAADVTLTDGRTLSNATVVSQSAGRVCIRHSGGITQVEKALLTGDLAKRYPADAAAAAREDDKLAAAGEAKAAKLEARAEAYRSAPSHQSYDTPTAPSDEPRRIKAAAAQYAERYYTRNSPGSTNSWAFSSGCVLDEPEVMAGWGDQWRVSGEIDTRAITAQGGLSSPSYRFEVIVAKRNGSYVVIDFTKR